ncbi:hypothetical protein GGU11DRAFT_528024 [Lentinula aff. detonsa]|nr:hypothetical protein GGU11DRAFT_528024 [Lentinula aff. detonsa]
MVMFFPLSFLVLIILGPESFGDEEGEKPYNDLFVILWLRLASWVEALNPDLDSTGRELVPAASEFPKSEG